MKINDRKPAVQSAFADITKRWRGLLFIIALVAGGLAGGFVNPVRAAVTIACPADIVAECASGQGTIVTFDVTATSNAGRTTITCKPASGSPFPLGLTTVDCVATDSLRGSARCSFSVVVRDTTPPVITVPPAIEINCVPSSGTQVDFTVSATDGCEASVIPICTPHTATVFPIGVTIVKCLARDGSGNLAQQSFTVTLRSDTAKPVLTLPDTLTVACTSPNGATATFVASASDDCSRAVAVTCTPPSGSQFPIGTTTVQCTAGDTVGNVAQGSFVVVVSGDCAKDCLSLRCPTDRAAECAGPGGTKVDFIADGTSACGDAVTTVCLPASGTLFPVGTTLVTCTAVDARHNTKSCQFQVTVRDTTGPLLSLPTGVQANCSSPQGAVVQFSVTATDACDPNPTVACTPASGSQFPIGTTSVQCAGSDAAGNVGQGAFTVVVSGDCASRCLALTCPADVVVELGPASAAIVKYSVVATNTCTGQPVAVTVDPPSGSAFPAGTTKVTCTVSDGQATQQCSFSVTVIDKTAPVIAAPRYVKVPCAGFFGIGAQAGANVSFTVTASDNSDPAPNLTCVPVSGSFFPVGTQPVTCTAQDLAGNVATREFDVIVYSSPKCEVAVTPVAGKLTPDNWGFEIGLTSWTKEGGDAFDYQPNEGDVVPTEREAALRQQIESHVGGDYWRNVDYSVGHRGNFWLSTGHNRANQPDQLFNNNVPLEELTGTLRSKIFEINTPFISFLLGGGNDMDQLRVEFLVAIPQPGPAAIKLGNTWFTPIYPATGLGRELMRRVILPVKDYIGQQAVFRIIDDSQTGHLNVDDFLFHASNPTEEKIQLGAHEFPAMVQSDGWYYDWDSPVWGFADMHTHPMSYLGFGFKVMHGHLDGPIEDALGDCNCTHGGFGFDNPCGDYLREIVIKMSDDKGIDPHREGWHEDPWKQFRKWPVFSTITHQQMWHEWIRRAYDGGLRVMVALCVNNPLMATVAKGDGPHYDKEVGDLQIQELTAFVGRHSDFMEIALDPIQLRDIVRRNKLAIIIGSELDDIANVSQDPKVLAMNPDDYSRKIVRDEIQRLYDMGLRYIFPVHLMNNKFGGTGVCDDMLNIANKFVNGEGFDLKAADQSDNITATLKTLDFTPYVGLGVAALAIGPALLPGMEVFGQVISVEFGPVPPGASSLGGALLPLGLMGLAPLVVTELVADGIPTSIFPLFGNYPSAPDTKYGHRNKKPLTDLGDFAIGEMMRRGMMIDMDHLSQDAAKALMATAAAIPGAYPLNSGHNSFREINVEKGENNRSPEQMEAFRPLGGLMGVGYENSETTPVSGPIKVPKFFSSQVKNDAAGTSRSFAQNYLYALEKLGRHGIALGTDVNGLIAGPGPRFGGQGSFALADKNSLRDNEIKSQDNGVLYEPKYGRPLTTAAFAGNAVDPDREFDPPRDWLGYAYNKDQRDFFAALRIFFWRKDTMSNDENAVEDELKQIEDGLVGAYDQRRVKEYAFGLLKGIKNWAPGSDILSGDTGTREQLGKAICRYQLFDEPIPDDIQNDADKLKRFKHHLVVWDDYQKAFGSNMPMKRCQTGAKEWDINFEGVAHYGLIPDFLQDLSNVGVNSDDLTPLFQSAEHFAQMWAHCLQASYAFVPHFDLSGSNRSSDSHGGKRQLKFSYAHGGDSFDLEESDNPSDASAWKPARTANVDRGPFATDVTIPMESSAKFYRLKKNN